jgi:F-type H+-transporting ATPase subunit gamma
MEAFRPYAGKFAETMQAVSRGMTGQFPLMEQRPVKKVELVVFTSDRGLCGSFNSNIIKRATQLTKEYRAAGQEVSYVCVGKKAEQILKKTGAMRTSYSGIMGHFSMYDARDIAKDVAERFLSGAVDRVELVYSRFQSIVVQTPTVAPLLPVQPLEDAPKATGSYMCEPSPEDVVKTLQPLYLNVQVYHAMLEISTCEHAARMSAMDNATSACKDIVNNLTILYNKARQAAVTNELMDIVGGAEALR